MGRSGGKTTGLGRRVTKPGTQDRGGTKSESPTTRVGVVTRGDRGSRTDTIGPRRSVCVQTDGKGKGRSQKTPRSHGPSSSDPKTTVVNSGDDRDR